MNCKYRIKTIRLAALAVLLSLTGCNRWLNIKPSNETPSDSFWSTKEDVQSVVIGSYVEMRAWLEKLIIWGDVRSDEMALGPFYTANANSDMIMLKELEIEPSTDLDFLEWVDFYSVIGDANQVIQFAPDVLNVDDTFTEEKCNQLVAEAKFQRALAYFYLVRTFRDVPFITEPYLDDTQDFQVKKTEAAEILEFLIEDLTQPDPGMGGAVAIDCIPISYTSAGDATWNWQNKGRATLMAFHALLADMYLWQATYMETSAERKACYQNAYDQCDFIEQSGMFTLSSKLARTTELFYTKNMPEEIFSLQWDNSTYSQKNDLWNWTKNTTGNTRRFTASQELVSKFTDVYGTNDPRGEKVSYTAAMHIEKFAKASTNDHNWIFYRYPDILLMKAEASIMLDIDGPYTEALEIVTKIRTNLELTNMPTEPYFQWDALDMILRERMMELCFEGKRWFDMVRVASYENCVYADNIINIMVASVPASKRDLYVFRLKDSQPWGFYFPIHTEQLDASGGKLVQNPYYK